MAVDVSRAVWVVSGDDPARRASYRYVALIPAAELGARVLRCDPETNPDTFLAEHRPTALVLGKALHQGFVTLAEAAKARGIPVLAAMCDWLFEDPLNITLARIADRVVVQTRPMATEIHRHFGVDAAIIEEPYEGPRGQPEFAPGATPRLLWFGHAANLDTLATGVAQAAAAVTGRLDIAVVTNRPDLVPDALSGLPHVSERIRITALPWSLQEQWRQLAACDAVLLPSHPAKEKIVKGHNRLVQSIHAGRLAIAYSLPQYQELAEFCWCGPELGDGLAWALANPSQALSRIVGGQDYIDRRFPPSRIARRWREEIARLALVPAFSRAT